MIFKFQTWVYSNNFIEESVLIGGNKPKLQMKVEESEEGSGQGYLIFSIGILFTLLLKVWVLSI